MLVWAGVMGRGQGGGSREGVDLGKGGPGRDPAGDRGQGTGAGLGSQVHLGLEYLHICRLQQEVPQRAVVVGGEDVVFCVNHIQPQGP